MNLLLSSIKPHPNNNSRHNHHHHHYQPHIYMDNVCNQNDANKIDVNNNNCHNFDDDGNNKSRGDDDANKACETLVKTNGIDDDDDAYFLNFSSYLNKELSEKQMRDLFYKDYILGAKIGEGGFGIIFSAMRRKDNKPVAVKVIKKAKVSQWYEFKRSNVLSDNDNDQNNEDIIKTRRIPLEIALMIRVRHVKNCIEILDYLEQKSCFIIVMERIESSKDLFDFITEKGNSGLSGGLSETMCREYFRQIVDAIQAIHALGVAHRDIKDENILVDMKTNQLKLIDFGAGAFFSNTNTLKFNDFHGTRVYAPPEWILNQCYYGDRAAVWSLGVLLFNMIYGDIPWEEDADIVNCRLYSKKNFNLKSKSDDAALTDVDDLIRKCLHINQSERIKLDEILQHKWFEMSLNVKSRKSFQ